MILPKMGSEPAQVLETDLLRIDTPLGLNCDAIDKSRDCWKLPI